MFFILLKESDLHTDTITQNERGICDAGEAFQHPTLNPIKNMKTKIVRVMIAFTLVMSVFGASQAMADLLYQQPFDGSGNAFSSQNDTGGGLGNFATVYDNFTLGANSNVNNVTWTGEYFNPPTQGLITAWTVSFYADSGNMPGGLLQSFTAGGTANETFLGNFAGFPTYTYSFDLGSDFAALAGTQYWVSVVPDLGFPPQWGWSSGNGGDGNSYQDFFGSRSALGVDLAYCLNGSTGRVPESGDTLMLLAGGLVALGILRRMSHGKALVR